jgi:hypothetical protein
MKSLITAALFGAFLSGCVAHAHAPHPHPHAHAQVKVKAWVWVPGYYRTNGVFIRGHWEIRHVARHKLNRYPRTHVRWVDGRRRPAPPPRRHRHHRPRR